MMRYPEYEESGVEWIGEIPKDWNAVPLTKYLESIIDYRGRTPEKTENGRFLVTAKNIRNSQIDYEISQEFTSENEYKKIMTRGIPQIGDVLFTTEAPLGEVANVDDVSIALAQRIIKFRPKPDLLNPYFLKYWLLSYSFQSDLQRYATGSTAQGIKASKLCLLKLNLPPLKEQIQIVKFLDWKTERIDELIRIKERQIELLQEQRTALINQVVTKGLDPNVEMKPSGVEWIGEIPAHWEIKKIKHVATLVSEKSTPETDAIKISPENVESETGKVLDFYSSYDAVGVKFQDGDVLFNKIRVYLNKVVFAKYDGYSLGEMIVIRPTLQCTSKYLFYFMLSNRFIEYCDSISYGAKMPRTAVDDILNAKIPIPLDQEKLRIASFLDRKTEQINELIIAEQRKIKLLKEYRQSLISEAVTGKIDVRNEV